MSILDTFYILFESDSSKLDKGLSDADKKSQGLIGKLGGVDVAANKMGGSLMQSLAGFAGVALAAVSLAAITRSMFEATKQADALNESTTRLGLNIETVSAWGDLVKKNGGSVDGFTSSIEGLNFQLAQMEVTGKSRAAPFLKELGIDLELAANKGKNAMDFLPQIADAFAGMDKQKSVALGKRLGFDQATIMTLQSGRREVEALLAKEKELGVVTQKQGEIADAFGDQLDDTAHAFRSIWLGVSEYVLPPLTWMGEKMQQVAVFMRKHSDFIVGLMIAIGAAIAFYVLPPLVSLAAATLVAFAPFILAGLLVAALAAAFALLYDDIMNFIEGGDSMIGQILERWPIIGEIAKSIGEYVKGVISILQWFMNVLSDVVQISYEGWKMLLSAFADTEAFHMIQNAIAALSEAFQSFGGVVGSVWDAVIERIKTVLGFVGKVIDVLKTIGGAISGGLGEVKANIQNAQGQLGAASGSALGSQTSNSINSARGGNRTNQVNVGKVEVHTQATDAQGISKAIGGSMQAQMRQAANNFDDGVLA